MIIDATDLILGRMSTFVAKKLLNGEEVIIINAGDAAISGKKENIFSRYKQKQDVGDIVKGPFNPTTENGIVRRTIRGMLPWDKNKGRLAYKRLRVYKDKPDDLKGTIETLKEYNVKNLRDPKYIKIKEVSKWLRK
jgi:large subunit ribosomal protein L13